jgi:hypothetical protein
MTRRYEHVDGAMTYKSSHLQFIFVPQPPILAPILG